MNSLSWLIYFGGVSENFGGLLIFLGIVIAAICVFWSGGCMATRENWQKELKESLRYGRNLTEADLEKAVDILTKKIDAVQKPMPWWPSILTITVAFFFWIAAAFMPNRDTVYAIAASQVGEQVISSPIGVKAGKAVEAWLDRQISGEKVVTVTTQ